MSRTRTALGSAFATTLIAGASVIGVPATAQAEPTDISNCKKTQSRDFNGVSSLDPYYLTKEVVGDDTVAPGGTVTYRTTMRGSGGLVDRIEDFHPEGFELVSARESVWKLIGGQKWDDVTDKVQKNTGANSVLRTSSGWTTALDTYVGFETTYKVPEDAKLGTTLNSGAGFHIVIINGTRVANPIDTCVTIREPNAVENVTGSLDDAGLGSVTSGSTSSATISSDPSGFVADIINGVDISEVLGS